MESTELEYFSAPFYLLFGSESCWKCNERQTVVGLAARDSEEGEDSEPFLLQEIEAMPDELRAQIQMHHQNFEWRESRAAGYSYFMNTCPCGAHFGDFYLFSEPGGAFFPSTEEDAAKIGILELPVEGTHGLACNPGFGLGGFILEHGKRLNTTA